MISASAQCVMTRQTLRVNHNWWQRAIKPKTGNVHSMSTTPCLTQHSYLAACISIEMTGLLNRQNRRLHHEIDAAHRRPVPYMINNTFTGMKLNQTDRTESSIKVQPLYAFQSM
jgi:hypothetical protein